MGKHFIGWLANREVHEALSVYGAVREASWDKRPEPEFSSLLETVADELLDDVSELAPLAKPELAAPPLPGPHTSGDDDVVVATVALGRYAITLGLGAKLLAERDRASSEVFRRLAGAASERLSLLAA